MFNSPLRNRCSLCVDGVICPYNTYLKGLIETV